MSCIKSSMSQTNFSDLVDRQNHTVCTQIFGRSAGECHMLIHMKVNFFLMGTILIFAIILMNKITNCFIQSQIRLILMIEKALFII